MWQTAILMEDGHIKSMFRKGQLGDPNGVVFEGIDCRDNTILSNLIDFDE